MGMIEIAEKHRGGGFGRAIKDLVRDYLIVILRN